ncbi:MAG: hypothetical protein LBG18_01435 [Mediterranea sp.]|jgi:hypothetical protein|nr:hypothetical protein [Mediterranea sp.]
MKLRMKAVMLFFMSVFLYSCENQPIEKTEVTLQKVGEIHNYLLKKAHTSASPQLILLNKKEDATIGEYFHAFKEILLNDDKYYYNESFLTSSLDDYLYFFEDFMTIKVNTHFLENARKLLFEKLENDENISTEVIEVLRKVSDIKYSYTDDELKLAISRSNPSEGSDLIFAFNEVAKASSCYWSSSYPITRDSSNRTIIIADGIGGVLGAFCGGVMSVIWGAAFSYSMDMCLEPEPYQNQQLI